MDEVTQNDEGYWVLAGPLSNNLNLFALYNLWFGHKATSTAATSGGIGIIREHKARAHQVLLKVNLGSPDQLERNVVHHHRHALTLHPHIPLGLVDGLGTV